MTALRTIAHVVADRRDVSFNLLLGPVKRRPVAWARQEAFHIARQLTGISYAEIGRFFNWRHHTSVIYGVAQVRERMRCDGAYDLEIEDMIEEARARLGVFQSRRNLPVFKSVRAA